jgi:multicomponent Na+:H+ antiporter subunit C
VIGFALISFAAALILKTYRSVGSVMTSDHADAEALGSPFDREATRDA